MTTRVMMVPHADASSYHGESGIKTLVRKYFHHLPQYDIELVGPKSDSFDVLAIHAGMSDNFGTGVPVVSHIHGLYWTADYPAYMWQHKANASVTNSIRHADIVTVPSEWVAKTLQRDMHIDPIVLRHGIDWLEWQHDRPNDGYVLWNKNRAMDVCSPKPVNELAIRRPNVKFLTTFADKSPTPNIKVTGVVTHDKMREYVQRAGVYLATTKETFGIGTLEAMAAGVPILGFRHGGTNQIVEHGKTGYLARVGDFDDLANGLDYCIRYRSTLSHNASVVAREKYGWEEVAKDLANIYSMADGWNYDDGQVTVVIPCYNKESTLERAVNSVNRQTKQPVEIIIVDNNSTDNSLLVARRLEKSIDNVSVAEQKRQGVAHARNWGIHLSNSEYICCLDADDEIQPKFLEVCVDALEKDKTLGLSYTRLRAIDRNGMQQVSAWPGVYNYDAFLRKQNQVPTCCVFRKGLWERAGGYRQRYAPHGAGAEDAELWLRMGALGFGGKLATEEALFDYHLGGQVSGDSSYHEANWLAWHPWIDDGEHPFASVATPSNGLSHDVRQYDHPVVSVIIPSTGKHLDDIIEALDSLEAQTYRKWEAIVVVDGKDDKSAYVPAGLKSAYPFVKWVVLDKNYGPGYARNRGVDASEAPLILFLDADDWLTPDCLELMLRSHETEPESIVYTDYYAHSFIESDMEVRRLQTIGRLKHYDPKTKEAIVYHKSLPYDCERAQRQPNPGDMYIWNLITSLVPKKHHKAIGGFDENMHGAWEDWDYWLRMSHKGYCFTHLAQPLVEYRFWTGTRRAAANPEESGDDGLQLGRSLIQYLQDKYEGAEKMACGGCAKHRAVPVTRPVVPLSSTLNNGSVRNVTSDQLVWVELIDGNVGSHPITFKGTDYGYRASGERFKMYRDHANTDRRVRIVEPDMLPKTIEEPVEEPLGEPEVVTDFAEWSDEEYVGGGEVGEDEGFDEVGKYVEFVDPPESDLAEVWGINEERIEMLAELDIHNVTDLLEYSPEFLMENLGVTRIVAKRMLSSAEQIM